MTQLLISEACRACMHSLNYNITVKSYSAANSYDSSTLARLEVNGGLVSVTTD